MVRLTDTQLVILSAASQREDRGVEPLANVQGKAAGKVVAKLVRAGLLEEIKASGSLPVWRRDDESGAVALRITSAGLAVIDAADKAIAAPEESGSDSGLSSAGEAITSRKRISPSARRPHSSARQRVATDSGENQERSRKSRRLAQDVGKSYCAACRPKRSHGDLRRHMALDRTRRLRSATLRIRSAGAAGAQRALRERLSENRTARNGGGRRLLGKAGRRCFTRAGGSLIHDQRAREFALPRSREAHVSYQMLARSEYSE